MVITFDLLPPRSEEAGRSWWTKWFLGPPAPKRVALSAEEAAMRWYHNLGFRLFINAYFAAAAVFLVAEFRRRRWRSTARLLVLAGGVWFFGHWLWSGTPVRGVPQRAVLLLIAIWLVCAWHALAQRQSPDAAVT